MEGCFEILFEGLQDGVGRCSAIVSTAYNLWLEDTPVRYSAAKGIARICDRLPVSFVDQVLDNILDYYTMYSTGDDFADTPATAEHPWHGATLACAELARRSLISDARLPEVLKWTSRVRI